MPNSPEELITATYDAEDSLIGSILIESTSMTRDAINEVAQIITPDDFNSYRDKLIYSAMLACPNPPHQINVARQMHIMNILGKDCIAHMSYCISIVATSLDYLNFAQAVKHYSEERHGIKHPQIKGMIL